MTIPQEQWAAFLREWQQSRAESESFKQEWRQFKEEDSAFKLEWQQFKKENEAFKQEWQQFRMQVATNFTKLEERVAALEEGQAAISIQITVIEQRFDIAEHKLGCIDRDLDKIDETLTQLRGRFDILEFNSQRDNSKIRMLESGYERHRDLIPDMIARHEDLLAGTSQSVDFMQTFHQQHATRLDMIEEALFPNWSSDGSVSENTSDVKYTPVTVSKADIQRFRHLRLRAIVLSRLVEPGFTLEESRQRRFGKFGGEQQFMEYWKRKQKAEYAQICAKRGTTPEKEFRRLLEKHGSNSNILKALLRDMKEKGKESRRKNAEVLANL
jgi:hypothetical protein